MNHPIAEIFSQGEEVITGQVADTNAAWLSQKLVQMGFVISRHTAVGDKLQDLSDLLTEISNRADFCICTGGLGPTVDDLTAEAVSQAFACPLQLDSVALAQIERYFIARNREMADTNRKQACFPRGAIRIDNAWGTAPGFAIQHKRCWFVFVPGVPTEMRHMFIEQIQVELERRFVLQVDKLVTIKSIGIGESDLQQKLNEFSLPERVQLSFRAAPDDVQTKLLFSADTADSEINSCVNQLVKKIGDEVFAVEESNKPSIDLVSVIAQLMAEKQYSLSVLETVTQGLISAKCIGQEWLQDSSYKQSIEPYIAQLGITRQDDLAQVAIAIAKQLKLTLTADLILVQLYLGDKEQLQAKEKSIVLYNVLQTPHGIYQNTIAVVGPIKRKQNQAAIRALDLLRRYLQKHAFNPIK
ncbi:MAG: molybdopterin-binding protein [Methylococcaceae bacterium]|nr:molybdopterin-binding protein [Methylococcaceae bacterium]